MNLGENIYKFRTQKNMSQGDLADALDVSRQSVSKWENNNAVPELDKTVKMAELFGISIDELVTGRKQETEAPLPSQPVQSPRAISVASILGILLLLLSCEAVILTLFFSRAYGFYITEGFLLALQFAIPSLMCLMPKSWDAYSLCWYASILTLPIALFFDYIDRRFPSLTILSLLMFMLCYQWHKRLDAEN